MIGTVIAGIGNATEIVEIVFEREPEVARKMELVLRDVRDGCHQTLVRLPLAMGSIV